MKASLVVGARAFMDVCVCTCVHSSIYEVICKCAGCACALGAHLQCAHMHAYVVYGVLRMCWFGCWCACALHRCKCIFMEVLGCHEPGGTQGPVPCPGCL